MNTKLILTAASLAATLIGCEVTAVDHRDHRGYDRGTVVVTAPVYVEEGAYYGNAVVAPYDARDYVWIDGAWYYYHPNQHVWVHAHRPGNWAPPREAHVYRNWNEHPMYKSPAGPRPGPGPGPVVVTPPPSHRPPVVVAAPSYVEEGDRVGGIVVKSPGSIDAFVNYNGGWFYFHPTARVWVRSNHSKDWNPPRNVRVYRGWDDYPGYQGRGR